MHENLTGFLKVNIWKSRQNGYTQFKVVFDTLNWKSWTFFWFSHFSVSYIVMVYNVYSRFVCKWKTFNFDELPTTCERNTRNKNHPQESSQGTEQFVRRTSHNNNNKEEVSNFLFWVYNTSNNFTLFPKVESILKK